MKAIRFHTHGAPTVLTVEALPDPVPGDSEALVRIEAASINPSDVKNVAGAMHQTTLPRTPGRDYAGSVASGPDGWQGAEVWGSGDRGFTEDGTHAQYVVVPVASLQRKPARLSFDEAACVGVNYLAAWRGLTGAARLQAGETLLIIGASGGVGSAAAQIGRQLGARVMGVDRVAPPEGSAILTAAERLIIGATDVQAAVLEATGGRGAQVVFDAVGGVMFRTALACLARQGRLVEISTTGAREVSFDLADFYHNESRLFGVDTLQMDLAAAGRVLEQLRPGFEAGDYRPAPIAQTFALDEAVEAYQAVSKQSGRVVLRPWA